MYDFFSLETLIKTWFAPWKDDVQQMRNIALSDQVHLWEQNIASRIFGFLIRSMVIIFAMLIIGATSAVGLLAILIWLLTPLLIIILPILAFLIL